MSPKHAGEYTCQPYNIRGSQGKSKPMTIEIRDPPTIVRRPEAEYQRNVGGKVTMPCQAAGPPKVSISWRRVSLLFDLHLLEWFYFFPPGNKSNSKLTLLHEMDTLGGPAA